jgi:hypothetical protein
MAKGKAVITTRQEAEQLIHRHHGLETPHGRQLAGDLIRLVGLGALTDDAVIALAKMLDTYEQRRHAGG